MNAIDGPPAGCGPFETLITGFRRFHGSVQVPFTARLPAWPSSRRPERLALGFGILTGVLAIGLAAVEFSTSPELDYHAYYFAGRAVLAGDPFVGWAITEGSFLTEKAYVYTPVTAPVFTIYGVFARWQIGYLLNIGVLFLAFLGIGRLVLRLLDRQGVALERTDRMLIMAFCVVSGHSILGMYRGNVDPLILVALAVGLFAIEDGDEALGGSLWAVAAHFKLFPALLGVWILYRRAYRAIAAAIVVGVGLLLVGVAAFGVGPHREFVSFILYERSRQGAFEGGLDPTLMWITLRRPLSQVLPLSGNQLLIVSLAIIVPFVYLVYRDAETDLDAIVAFFATMVALLITVVPSTLNYVVYLYFPLVGLVYLARDPVAKGLFVAGLLLVSLPLFPQHVELLVGGLPMEAAIVATARAVMTYASIPLVGFLLLLGGCIRFVRAPTEGFIES